MVPGRGSGDGASRGREPFSQILQRLRALVVGVGGDVRNQEQALPPVVEHDGAVGQHQRDRGAEGIAARERVPVQELRRLVREEAHQAAGERGEVGDPWRPERRGQRDEVGPRVPGVRHLDRQPIRRVEVPETLPVEHDDRGGIAGDERIPPPPLGTLDALEQDAGSIPRERREDADRRGHVGQQLGPHRCEREALGRAFERFSIGTNPHAGLLRRVPLSARSSRTLPATRRGRSPVGRTRLRSTRLPDMG